MRIIRYVIGESVPVYGVLVGDAIHALEGGDPFEKPISGPVSPGHLIGPLSLARLLAPCQPCKIVAIGRNYPDHAAEHGAQVPAEPLMFLKPGSAVIGPGEPIVLPPQSARIEHEAELVAVIGRRGRHIPRDEALRYVLGYTCGNDVTARDLQRSDGQWSRSKGFDTFCPLGPWIETDLDPYDVQVIGRVNGQVRQLGHTRQMVFPIDVLVSYVSSVMMLEPGDLIMTGTPAGVGPLRAGDGVEVEVAGIGVLRNPVVDERGRAT